MASEHAMAQLSRKRCLNDNAEALPADRAAFQQFLSCAISGRVKMRAWPLLLSVTDLKARGAWIDQVLSRSLMR